MRFQFGSNWADFVEKSFSEEKLQQSMEHMRGFLRVEDLKGKSFLDIGSGSGLHSLAAHRLGAERIVSFDYDANSVATTEKLREFAGAPDTWTVKQGSVLDRDYVAALGQFDVVYSWGVLHHTGEMWNAIRSALQPVKSDGVLYIALYSTEMYSSPPSHRWLDIKRRYNLSTPKQKRKMEWEYAWRTVIKPELQARRNPLKAIGGYGTRGMTFWTDVRDWLGGYPMEFSGFRDTVMFCRKEKGLDLVNSISGEGNTEFLFARLGDNPKWRAIEDSRKQIPLPGPYQEDGRYGFTADLPHLSEVSDFAGFPRRSRLMIYENGEPLGLSHYNHEDIRVHGLGRFIHWGEKVYFSTSDSTNPNFNGRSYTYVENY